MSKGGDDRRQEMPNERRGLAPPGSEGLKAQADPPGTEEGGCVGIAVSRVEGLGVPKQEPVVHHNDRESSQEGGHLEERGWGREGRMSF